MRRASSLLSSLGRGSSLRLTRGVHAPVLAAPTICDIRRCSAEMLAEKVCSLYGAGFYYMPGTDICLKIGARRAPCRLFARISRDVGAGAHYELIGGAVIDVAPAEKLPLLWYVVSART
jgi:Porin subfamily